jgi:Tol biopolymer transport system component
MAITPGTRLGPYEVTAQIGVGGMGEVYRARDTTLNRDVAVKVLPAAVSGDTERLARFQREAQSLAALNHPNIAHIHGLETSGATPAIVMELVEGPTLADRIKAGPVQLNEALDVARQIADALAAAHARGIVHRDLKPANIKVRDDGAVKVLDFGLAKALDTGVSGDGQIAGSSATVTSPALTQMGLILGTAAYMSPEQAKGKPVDARADVWAFGCVLYEMLSGQQTWDGETVTDVIAALVAREPNWRRLPATVSPRLRYLLERCLEKDPAKRTQNIGEVRAELDRVATDPTGAAAPQPTVGSPVGWRSRLVWPLTTVVLALAAAVAVWVAMQPAPQSPVWLAMVHPGPEAFGGNNFNANIAVSPDGTRIAYTTTTVTGNSNEMPLYGRALGAPEPTRLADAARAPFFSPDGEWVGFVGNNGPLMKVAFAGGPALKIGGNAGANRGITWGPDGTIVFAASDAARGLSRISDAGGGDEEVLTTPDRSQGEVDHLFPAFLPDGQTLLFTVEYEDGARSIALFDLAAGTYSTLIPGGTNPQYATSGHIIYGVSGTLRAVAFDPDRREVRGTPVPVVDGVVTWLSGAASFGIAANGTLVYLAGRAETERSQSLRSLVAVGRDGAIRPLSEDHRSYGGLRVSPDGRRIAVEVREQAADSAATQIWIVDADSGLGTQLTFEGTQNRSPVWSVDGRVIYFASNRDPEAQNAIYRQAADFSGEAEFVYRGAERVLPEDMLSERALLIVGGTPSAIQSLDLDTQTVTPILAASTSAYAPRVSPDGRWIAYESYESGQGDVFVRPAPPASGAQRRVSEGFGFAPVWSPTGDELYFEDGRRELMAVPVQLEPSFTLGRAVPLFSVVELRDIDVARGGEFISSRDPSADGARQTRPEENLIVVQHWFEELKRLVPVR